MELIKNLISSNTFLTVISGVIVFAISQLFNEYFLKPIQKYKKLRADIAYALIYFSNLYSNPLTKQIDTTGTYTSASDRFRELSAEVRAMVEHKPIYVVFIPRKKKLLIVSSKLMRISNSMFCNETTLERVVESSESCRNEICRLLNMNKI